VIGVVSDIYSSGEFGLKSAGVVPASNFLPGRNYVLSPTVPGQVVEKSAVTSWPEGSVRLKIGIGSSEGLSVNLDESGGSGGLSEIPFEFCIEAGYAETFVVDLYVTSGCTITKAVLESDGTLNGVVVKINSTPITGLDNITVSTVAVFTATANNAAVTADRITITTSGSDTGTPTIIRGKIVL